jgi:GNAT superfamily N-acetyltransferase
MEQKHLGRFVASKIARLFKVIYYRRTIVITAFPLRDFEPRYRGLGGHQEVIRVTSEQLPTLSSPFLDPFTDWMKQWVERGDMCFVALIGGEVAGFIDLMTQSFRDSEGLQIEVAEGECLVRNLQVFPHYRSGAAAGILHDVAFSYARDQGIDRIIGPIDRTNIPSLNIAKHVGFREIERVRCGRIFKTLTFSRVVWRTPHRSAGREIVW